METIKLNFLGRRILVVEDDGQLRNTIADILVNFKATVETAQNGAVAKRRLDEPNVSFDIVLSDIRMPEMDGIELLRHCKAKYSQTKFLIFTGFSEYLETQTASELGADAFLAKPFRLSEMASAVEHILLPKDGGIKEAASDLDAQMFCCVGIDDFLSTTRLPSDIYIKIGSSKFVKLAKESSEIELTKLEKIKDHKVKHLFVRTEDFHKYTGLNLKVANSLAKSNKFSEEKKLRQFKHVSEMLLQQAFVVGIDKSVCDNAYAMLDNTIKAVGENENLLEVLMSLQAKGDKLYAHSLGVSVYAAMIGTKIGWTSIANQYKISLAGLFHDVGFKELPADLHDKPRFKMTEEDVRLYETHAARGREILQSIPGYPSDLAMIAGQHHENVAGGGYPQRLGTHKIHPIAKLIRLADELADRLSVVEAPTAETAAMVLQALFLSSSEDFDAGILGGAFDLFRVSRPKGLKTKVGA